MSNQFQQAMSVSGEVSDTLIDSEYFYKPVDDTKSGSWSEVAGTKSWHTGAVIASSSRSITTNGYGRLPGSVRSFNSSFAERSHSASGQIEMRNGFAKVTACVCTPEVLRHLTKHELTSDRSLRRSWSKMPTSPAMRIPARTTTMMTTTTIPVRVRSRRVQASR